MTLNQRIWLSLIILNFATVTNSTGTVHMVAYLAMWISAVVFCFSKEDRNS